MDIRNNTYIVLYGSHMYLYNRINDSERVKFEDTIDRLMAENYFNITLCIKSTTFVSL